MLSYLILLLCKTVPVSDPSEELQTDSLDVYDPAYLEYLDYKSGNESIAWTNVFPVAVILGILLLIIYQLVLMYRNNTEIAKILDSCTDYHTNIQTIHSFYEDTENQFSSLEEQAKCAKIRHKNAENVRTQMTDFNTLKQDIQHTKDRWCEEYAPISHFTIKDTPVLDLEIKAELTMAKGIVDKEINIITENMCEDHLSLEEVEREVRILQYYICAFDSGNFNRK